MRVDCLWKAVVRLVPLTLLVASASTIWTNPARADGPSDPIEPTWTPEQKQHWSFRTPTRPQVPAVVDGAWGRNPLDAFILQTIEADGLKPAPEASRETLVRRLRFDLTGLPPSLEEVASFVNDQAPDAYDRLVDRLLASPQYGERWARQWLDLARYADSDGFKNDKTRPTAWRYRDWVVNALNSDMPYDRFLALQLAGDEIEPGNLDAFVATGFNRNWPFEDNNMVPGLNRQWMLDDVTDTTSSVVLGLTVACARCHDHKYDPISQVDYYRIQALFAASEAKDDYVVAPVEEQAAHARLKLEHDGRVDHLRREIEAFEKPYAAEILKDKLAKLPDDVRAAFEADPMTRTPEQVALLKKHAKAMTIEPRRMMAALPDSARETWQGRRKEMETLNAQAPAPLPTASGMTDAARVAPPLRLLRKGNFANPGDVVGPGFLSVLASLGEAPSFDSKQETTGRREALARWVTRPDHPLTARVMVNRLWQGHFGRGIVATTSDFGTQGTLPTHPELLDWLATELVAKGWSLKAMHRLMVTSATYRQSSVPSPKSREADPDNISLSRMNRRRLEGEAVRDALLAASGQIDLRVGGPSVFPELPPGVEAKGGWPKSKSEADRNRRSLYVFVKRNLKYPLFDAFDVPDTNLTCPERNVSVNAPQALMLLNSGMVLDHARNLAGRVYAGPLDRNDLEALVDRAYRLSMSRPPSVEEKARAVEFLKAQPDHLSGRIEPLATPLPMPEGPTPAQAAALVDFCHVLLNLNEFVFVD